MPYNNDQAAFLTQSVEIDGQTVKFEIWDTAGQERYHSLAPMYYRGAKAAIVVYDITSKESFFKAKNWVTELQQSGTGGMIIALAGNKADLPEQREVSTEEAKEYADQNSLFHMEVSAKEAININGLFCSIARELARNNDTGDARDVSCCWLPYRRERGRKEGGREDKNTNLVCAKTGCRDCPNCRPATRCKPRWRRRMLLD